MIHSCRRAIIDGFRVGAGGKTYVLPLEAVEECLDFAAARARGAEDGLLQLRGAAVPYALLDQLLYGDAAPMASAERPSVVIVRHGGRRVGLVVERLEGNCQAVVKPLAGALGQPRGVAGSTILGNGRVALIIDVAGLANALAGTN